MALDTDKLNYSIGQVAEIAGVAQSTLRYWETVIHRLEPQKTAGGSRRYNKDTIELILVVRDLLHEQGLTIKGANLYLEKYKKGTEAKVQTRQTIHSLEKQSTANANSSDSSPDLQHIQNELIEIRKLLE